MFLVSIKKEKNCFAQRTADMNTQNQREKVTNTSAQTDTSTLKFTDIGTLQRGKAMYCSIAFWLSGALGVTCVMENVSITSTETKQTTGQTTLPYLAPTLSTQDTITMKKQQAWGGADSTQKPRSEKESKRDGVGILFEVSAFCRCSPICTRRGDGITASGVRAKEGVTVAAPRSIPFGTKIRIQGVGQRIVQDRLSAAYDHRIDLFFESHEAAVKFGKKTLTVEVMREKR